MIGVSNNHREECAMNPKQLVRVCVLALVLVGWGITPAVLAVIRRRPSMRPGDSPRPRISTASSVRRWQGPSSSGWPT